jgi:hypothetical protein
MTCVTAGHTLDDFDTSTGCMGTPGFYRTTGGSTKPGSVRRMASCRTRWRSGDSGRERCAEGQSTGSGHGS